MLGHLFKLVLVLSTILEGWVGGWVALEEWKVRLTSAKVEVEAELGNNNINNFYILIQYFSVQSLSMKMAAPPTWIAI